MTARTTMTPRTTITALAASSLALAMSLCTSTPAHAATGTFSYKYATPGGTATGELTNPRSSTCIDIPEVRDTDRSAHTPVNRTTSTVTMFTGPDCTGDYFSLRPGGRASSRLLLKSAVFS
ncbi:hypothetical protein GCM10022224_014420 [Nonomuraea antimicrobica]|uniref:Peptidase inhibitor family I36 n=1 Tax=Nonomuraea antimicrobica TaxID=561173 RepID=A0ABP7BAI3_9ACTN